MTKSAYKKHIYQYRGFVVVQLFALFALLLGGCKNKESSALKQDFSDDYALQLEASVDDSNAKERIERIIGTNLPASARNFKYHSISYGLGRGGVGYGYFEIHRADLPLLLEASDYLPDPSELGQHPVAKENVEKATKQWQNFITTSDHEKKMKQSGENIEWWNPLKLNDRRYASKTLGESRDTALVYGPQMDICIGRIKDDLMGLYFVYHLD